jgi:type VI secretion system secreted protein VgrG
MSDRPNAIVSRALSAAAERPNMLRIVFPKGDAPANVSLAVNGLDASEALSQDFHFTVELLADKPTIALKDVLGKMVAVELIREDGSSRWFNGFVFDFRYVRSKSGFAVYDMVLLPWLAFLRYRRDNRLFHGLDVQQQSQKIFDHYEAHDWRSERISNDAPMTDACQFDESDYNYVHRRWEALGWHYHYEHRKDGHTLVLGGDSTAAAPVDGSGKVQWVGDSGMSRRGLKALVPVRTVATTQYTASSFDFKRPARPTQVAVGTVNQQGTVPATEIFEYAGAYGFKDAAAADAFVQLRIEEIEAAGKHFQAAGDDDHVQCGRCFELTGEPGLKAGPQDKNDREHLILSATHTVTNSLVLDAGQAAAYECTLVSIRKKIPWRPGRGHNSIEPKIFGLQTAIVVGPAGEEIHTDEYGRVRVQFHWDREGTFDEKSSAWVRVASNWAGSNFGFISLPRIGQEVVVQFLDGNPDRPLITGRLYNAQNMPPWELPANATQSGVLTRSSKGGAYGNANAIRFEDKKGEEQLWIHAEKNQDNEVENDETTDIGRDRTEHVGRHEKVTIDGNHIETVKLAKAETVYLAKALSIGLGYQTSVGAAMNTTVVLGQFAQIGLSKSTAVGKHYEITAGDSFSVTVGKARLTMTKDGKVTIVGSQFLFDASGPVQINGKDIDLN